MIRALPFIFLVGCMVAFCAPHSHGQPTTLENPSPNGFYILNPKPNNLMISNGAGVVLTITYKGELIVGEGYAPTEAGEAFIKALRPQLKQMMDCK